MPDLQILVNAADCGIELSLQARFKVNEAVKAGENDVPAMALGNSLGL